MSFEWLNECIKKSQYFDFQGMAFCMITSSKSHKAYEIHWERSAEDLCG